MGARTTTTLVADIPASISERGPTARSPAGFRPVLPLEEAGDPVLYGENAGEAINGLSVIIEYRDAKGIASIRQISCIRIEEGHGKQYLRAFCHQRRALRVFIIQQIAAVIDIETGELLSAGEEYFSQFTDKQIAASHLGWGLSPKQRADLGAGLTMLTFLSRCDGRIHPAETEEIDTFVAAWWMRAEIWGEIPEEEINAYSRRLAPDVEAFLAAARRVGQSESLSSLVASYAMRVIVADEIIADEERRWVSQVVDWLGRGN